MSLDNSPYATPSSEISISSSGENGICQLPRFSAWMVLLLMIVTLGFYYYYWLYTRTLIINRVCKHKISTSLSGSVIALFVVTLILGIYSIIAERFGLVYDSQIALADSIFNLACSVTSIFWLFTIRNRLHYMCKANKTGPFWMNGLITFFGTAIYLQYKITRLLTIKTICVRKRLIVS
ncbi:DUF4234 domain-containing protein [Zooshikella ganghwensis]|uniref:DUF4234 domain-containing protein n=1 Tax=Zooshikella ganghwensis TaxID=202772 RepID=A0A4P9VET2_9GAMM|nr:DUF4234 domain-containing protein [Zooshikella ganghwensis]